ncbi:MAG TPA: hypothetical protein VE988_21225 [Gemmataceae bacterium]|nr:hypothetical protein [Gemmataceae bacterium]
MSCVKYLTAGVLLGMAVIFLAAGCHDHGNNQAAATNSGTGGQAPQAKESAETVIQAERAKLSEEDRKLVDAQEWCVVSTDNRLGIMKEPIKILVKDQPVFLCCKHCEKLALKDPDATLVKLEELKVKKLTQISAK